ncbi:MAG: TNT domain-containing protein, partial [Bacteroidota bacterium]|nr:TNT domain-containing protein [Bacteroidota bacterium]
SMEDYLEGKVGVVNSILNDVSFTDFANTVEEFKNGANAGLAQQSYNLWKEQRWGELEQLFTAHNFNGGWPPYGGAISAQNTSLQVGKEFDRFGGWIDNSGFHDNGFFASPRDVPFEQRALPQSSLSKPHKKYRVLISFEVEEGQAIPWFNQPGMGTQYKFSETIDKLKQNGFIEEIQ